MPAKAVVQYTCDRCARVWYVDPDSKIPERKLALSFAGTVPKDSPDPVPAHYVTEYENLDMQAKFECLCDSCAKTVGALVKAIAKEFKPRERKAKKKGESDTKGQPPVTNSPSTTPGAPPTESQSSPPPTSPVRTEAGAGPGAGAKSSSASVGGLRPTR